MTYSQPTARLITQAEWMAFHGYTVQMDEIEPTVICLSVDYHRRTVQKRQAELDRIYADGQGLKNPPDSYRDWLQEFERAGKDYAKERMVQEFDPAKHLSPLDFAASKLPTYEEKSGKKWDYIGLLAKLQVALALFGIALMIFCFVH